MGGSSSRHFSNYDWQFVSKPTRYDVERDAKTGISAERHIVPNNPKISEKDQMEVYHYRNLTNKPIVKVYDADYVKSKGGGACGNAKDIVVHSEYIPYRLSDTRNLNHGQALYILSEALSGFEELFHRFGPFPITDDHIGFNQIGQTKVWHSPNFATNHLDRDQIILMSTANLKNLDQRMVDSQEQQMVEDIWMAVDQHANISPQFTSNTNCFRGMNFINARKSVGSQIAKGSTYVPDYLNFRNSMQSSQSGFMNQGGYSQSGYHQRGPQGHNAYQSNVYTYQNNQNNQPAPYLNAPPGAGSYGSNTSGYQANNYANQPPNYNTPNYSNQPMNTQFNTYSNQQSGYPQSNVAINSAVQQYNYSNPSYPNYQSQQLYGNNPVPNNYPTNPTGTYARKDDNY